MKRGMLTDLSAEFVRSLFEYDPTSGFLIRKIDRKAAKAGSIAGNSTGRHGYTKIEIRGHSYQAHRLAWLHFYGEWPPSILDHVDGNRTNNAIKNLRLATLTQNQQNKKIRGYFFCKERQRYRVAIRANGKCKWADFRTEDEARAGRAAATRKYFGEFSPHAQPLS